MKTSALGTALLGATGLAAPAPAASSTSSCNFQYFEQQIDHFGKHNGTFNQKFNLVTDFYKAGGPIMLFQGEESSELDCVDTTIMHHYAQELGGIAISIEHRYFGASKPFNATNPITQRADFDYLTLDNVLSDATTILDSVKKNVTGASNAKTVVASGSYGGFLATMFRQNRPNEIWGAIASAPPLIGLSTDKSVQDMFGWSIWLNNVYEEASMEAADKISEVYLTIEERIASGNLSDLQQRVGLCGPANKTNALALLQYLKVVHANSAEFNYAQDRPGRSVVTLPLEKVINITLAGSDPIDILNQTLWMWYGPLGSKCIDLDNLEQLAGAVPLIETAPFNFLLCNYYPFSSAGNTPNGTIFPAGVENAAFNENCQKSYNITPRAAHELRKQYKYTDKDLMNSTRIMWVTAQYDPSSGCAPNQPGINAPISNPDPNVSRTIYVSNMAHREDLFAPADDDRETVTQVRNTELNIIKSWLASAE